MRVGVTLSEYAGLNSLKRFTTTTYRSLSACNELVFLPREFRFAAPEEQDRMAEELLRGCDVVVGMLDPVVLAARRRLGARVPVAAFMHGELPVGGWILRDHLAHLTAGDVLLVACTSEVDIARRLVRNATVRVLPFAYAEDAFYPLDAEERREARARLGFGEDDRIVLYSGRLTPEKSVHWLLAVFDVVARRVPGAHLVLAGTAPVENGSMNLFGVEPVELANTYSRLIARLDRPDRVRQVSGDDRGLRELYNVADVAVNLTLNPDENFGMSQVEAMACGTPVVGTAWGGLKDTVVDGVSGWRVSTVPTATGVRLGWWEAANRVAALLEDRAAREAFRPACIGAAERYTGERFAAAMQEILAAAVRGRDRLSRPLQATPFAQELWSVCDLRWPEAVFRRGPRSEELHRALVTPFTAASPAHAPAWEEMRPDQVLSLATPVHLDEDGALRLDDVFHARRVEVPEAHGETVRAVLARMRARPALHVAELEEAVPAPGLADALAWMLEAGLVLRTLAVPGWMDPAVVGPRLAEPVFAVQEVGRGDADLIVYTS